MPKATSYPSSKLKQWEKERRERLNICFRDLGSLLPSHDPAISLSKVQILQKAAKYIRELQSENKVLVENGVSEVSAKHLQVLRQRSDDLLRRVQQLVELLRDAGIAVPHAVSLKNEPLKQRQLKWDNKIKPEDAKILEEKAKNSMERLVRPISVDAEREYQSLQRIIIPASILGTHSLIQCSN